MPYLPPNCSVSWCRLWAGRVGGALWRIRRCSLVGVHHSWWAGRKARRAGECAAQRRRPHGGIHACNPWSSAGQPGRGGRQPDMAAGGASRELRSNRARGGQKWSAASKLALRALTSKLTPRPMHPLGSPAPRFRPKCAKAAAGEQANMHPRSAAGAPCNTFRGGLSLPEEVIFSGPGNACIMLAHARNFHSRYPSATIKIIIGLGAPGKNSLTFS